ncbi:MAG: hypothetical protein FGM24_04405 [Candidatus Kapabacteria bacterium]|nr:hypothetical protein [Candidatus Kapabacteria bacterium]
MIEPRAIAQQQSSNSSAQELLLSRSTSTPPWLAPGAEPKVSAALHDVASPDDYAREVGELVRAARSPVAIGGGLVIGGGAGYGVYRLRHAAGHNGVVLPTVSGIFAATIGHGLISWISYRTKGGALGDQETELIDDYKSRQTSAEQAATELKQAATRYTKAAYHPVSIGIGLGSTIAATYGLYRWRNPRGTRKQRWVLPLIGGLITGGAVQSLSASIIASLQSGEGLSGTSVVDFSSVSSTVMTAATIVCLYGGGKYLFDTWRRPARGSRTSTRSLRDNAPGASTSPMGCVVP